MINLRGRNRKASGGDLTSKNIMALLKYGYNGVNLEISFILEGWSLKA